MWYSGCFLTESEALRVTSIFGYKWVQRFLLTLTTPESPGKKVQHFFTYWLRWLLKSSLFYVSSLRESIFKCIVLLLFLSEIFSKRKSPFIRQKIYYLYPFAFPFVIIQGPLASFYYFCLVAWYFISFSKRKKFPKNFKNYDFPTIYYLWIWPKYSLLSSHKQPNSPPFLNKSTAFSKRILIPFLFPVRSPLQVCYFNKAPI